MGTLHNELHLNQGGGGRCKLAMDAELCTQLSTVLQCWFEVAHASASGGPQLPPGANTTYVCVGDEWHRFPSAFFLPGPAYRLAFVRAGFRGLLPRAFDLAQVWVCGQCYPSL